MDAVFNFYRIVRKETFRNFQDAMAQDLNLSSLGKHFILPATHTGGQRYMHQNMQDAPTYSLPTHVILTLPKSKQNFFPANSQGLLEDDLNWIETIREATTFRSPSQHRDLFAIIIVTCNPSSSQNLYEEFKEDLADDIIRRQEGLNGPRNFTNFIFSEPLILIKDKVQEIGGRDLTECGLPVTDRRHRIAPTKVFRESFYDMNELQSFIEDNEPRLTEEQRQVFDRIYSAEGGHTFFITACGGTGKS